MKYLGKLSLFTAFAVSCTLFVRPAQTQSFTAVVDIGQQHTKYGSSYDSSYKGQTTDAQFADFGMSLLLSPHSKRNYGYQFAANGDVAFPFENGGTTGGILSFGGSGMMYLRAKDFAAGSGFDVHYFAFPADASNQVRPSQLLVGIPVLAKFSFLPSKRAFVQGGGMFYVASESQNVVTDSLGDTVLVSNAVTSLSKSHQSGDVRVGVGYKFPRSLGIRANYVLRDVHFDVTDNPTYSSYYDFHEQTVSGGVFLVF